MCRAQGADTTPKIACEFIDFLTSNSGFVDISPLFIDRAVTLAAITILKIQRSYIASYVNLEEGERAYSNAIRYMRQASLQSSDTGQRIVTILTQLWTSKSIFRRSDGSIESLGTRIRSRLSMSIVFDCFWYWRVEFANYANPYKDDPDSTCKWS
jgi:transcriptional regulatory protein LEU3